MNPLYGLQQFVSRLFTPEPPRDVERLAAQAKLLLDSPIFNEAYHDEMSRIVQEIFGLDMANPADRERALLLLTRAQALQNIVRQLGGYLASNALKSKTDSKRRAA
jgi:hypothetical protein